MHTFSEVYKIFQINRSTLYRWISHANIMPHKDPLNARRKLLSDAQVLVLARLHNRVIMLPTGSGEISALTALEERVAKLESELKEPAAPNGLRAV
jgi:hypothetical protein